MHGRELPIPPATSVAQEQGAVEFLVETLRATTEPITLVPVGPLSNIGAALALDPRIAEAVHEVVIMGGGHHVGNDDRVGRVQHLGRPGGGGHGLRGRVRAA